MFSISSVARTTLFRKLFSSSSGYEEPDFLLADSILSHWFVKSNKI